MDDMTGLAQLGSKQTEYKLSRPNASMLETFPNQYPNRNYTIQHECFEFSSLCPKTGQPDFGVVTVSYIPDQLCVETKSLKLYLFAYRNEGSFMETLTNKVLEDLLSSVKPKSMRVTFEFNSRGGIGTKVFAHYPDL